MKQQSQCIDLKMVSFASLEAIEAVISQLIVVGACAISRPAPLLHKAHPLASYVCVWRSRSLCKDKKERR